MEMKENKTVLYENTCVCTKKVYREAGEQMVKGLGAMSVLCAVSGVVTVFLAFRKQMFWGELFALLAIALLILVNWLPYQWAKKRYQEEEQQYGEPVTLQTSFQEDALTVRVAQNEKTVTLSYEQVEKLKRLDHIYILKMRDGSILLLDREGFTKGDAAAFVSFIKEKCTQHMESQA